MITNISIVSAFLIASILPQTSNCVVETNGLFEHHQERFFVQADANTAAKKEEEKKAAPIKQEDKKPVAAKQGEANKAVAAKPDQVKQAESVKNKDEAKVKNV